MGGGGEGGEGGGKRRRLKIRLGPSLFNYTHKNPDFRTYATDSQIENMVIQKKR